MKNVAIIGTAGRDKTKPMTKALWEAMKQHARKRFTLGEFNIISGGAPWADHLAVWLYLEGHVQNLTLHLPAPFSGGEFVGEQGTSGGAENWYHEKFKRIVGSDARLDIARAILHGATVTQQPEAKGYGGMFARNALVARDADFGLLAYTWGEGNVPADGGTMNTWKAHEKLYPDARRVHVPLSRFGD